MPPDGDDHGADRVVSTPGWRRGRAGHVPRAGVSAAARVTLAPAKTARDAACGRTRARRRPTPHPVSGCRPEVRHDCADRVPGYSGVPRTAELIGTTGQPTLRTATRRPDAGVGVH